MDGFYSAAALAFLVNVAIVIWSSSRAQAKGEAALRQAITESVAAIERQLNSEREERAKQFYEAREFARQQAADASGKADAAHIKISDVELRLLQMFTNYPTKTDLRELFGEKFEPVVARLDTVYEELVRRGVHSTAVRPTSFGEKP